MKMIMAPDQFAYWLQGFVEMNPNVMPTEKQWCVIQEHLKLVFKKVTPEYIPVSSDIDVKDIFKIAEKFDYSTSKVC